jgi:hypothetical protein
VLNLAEYRRRDKHLADYLPWACLVAPGILLNKDGSFQRTLRYRGPDLDSATEAELVAVSARLNNALKRFGEGWALFFEAERVAAHDYPPGRFADAASWLVDEERRAAFEAEGAHFESRYFLTFLYLPPFSIDIIEFFATALCQPMSEPIGDRELGISRGSILTRRWTSGGAWLVPRWPQGHCQFQRYGTKLSHPRPFCEFGYQGPYAFPAAVEANSGQKTKPTSVARECERL